MNQNQNNISDKKMDKNNWYMIGVILVVIIVFKGGGTPFLESFVTTCTNSELDTLSEVKTHYLENGNIIELIQSTPYVTQSDNATITIMMQQNLVNTSLTLISNSLVSCDSYIQYLKLTDSSDLAFYNQKIATNFNGTYYWCNPSNTITFKGDISDFEGYVNEFIFCQTQEIIDEDEEVNGSSSSSSSSSSSTTQTNITTTEEPDEPDITKNRLMFASIILLIVGLVYYFGYEKGPNKGLIRKKRRK